MAEFLGASIGLTLLCGIRLLASMLIVAIATYPNVQQRRKALFMSNHEVLLALGVAGLVNVAMIILAARAFHDGSHDQVTEIEVAYRTSSTASCCSRLPPKPSRQV